MSSCDTVHAACPDVTETIKWGFPISTTTGLCAIWLPLGTLFILILEGRLDERILLMRMASSEVAMGHLGQLKTLKRYSPTK